MKYKVYADGSCKPTNPGPAGCATIILNESGELIYKRSAFLGHGTNNIAEIKALDLALSVLYELGAKDSEIIFYADSQYVIGMFSQGWSAKANVALIESVKKKLKHFPNFKFEWVKGHSKHKYNDLVDQLAKDAVDNQEGIEVNLQPSFQVEKSCQSKTDIVLFDMDGTITDPRQKVTTYMVGLLTELSQRADLGIVSGSGIDFMLEQCQALASDRVLMMPCNGTQLYKYDGSQYQCKVSMSLEEKIGRKAYIKLTAGILKSQAEIFEIFQDIPLVGNHISHRGSTVNWSVLGRNATQEQRQEFAKLDQHYQIRETALGFLEQYSRMERFDGFELLTVVLSGETGLDIYPKEWDKTFCLNHIGEKTPWFVGDMCQQGGIDYTIYELLKKEGRAFETSGPIETQKIIKKIMERL